MTGTPVVKAVPVTGTYWLSDITSAGSTPGV